jgi:hypothetical protein
MDAVLDRDDEGHVAGSEHWARPARFAPTSSLRFAFDCSSFQVMRHYGLRTGFALDPHFREQGFELVP